MLAEEFSAVRYIQSAENIGFARSNNLGVQSATGRYLLLLNPDTEFIDDSLETLWQQAISLPNAGATGCRLLNRDRSLQTSCVQAFPTAINQALDSELLRKLLPRSSLWGVSALFTEDDRPTAVEAISGACMLIKHSFFEEVGGFTESYFMYGEDLDLCFKLTQAGHGSFFVPNACLVHFGGGSSTQRVSSFSIVMMRVSVHKFIATHRGQVAGLLYRVTSAASALVRFIIICPLTLFGDRVVHNSMGTLRKWSTILLWSLGLRSNPASKIADSPSRPAPAEAKTN